MSDPNPEQQEVIESLDGIHVVDAGPGTGKTFALTRRYAHMLEHGIKPDDMLLITFTNNAAAQLKERVIRRCDYPPAKLRDAPINTFHGVCNQVLTRHGFDSPRYLGIRDSFSSSTRILESEVVEDELFRWYLNRFRHENPEYTGYLQALIDPGSLLGLIQQLAAKGVFPTRDGWYGESEECLDGDLGAFMQLFREANEPNEGARGPTQSDLRKALNGFGKNRCYREDAPTKEELRGSKQVDPGYAEEAFNEDREELKGFVHDVYFGYIEHALGQNYVNFGFLQMLTYVLLREDDGLREDLAFDYVMVDEFQDTSEIQFKLAMLLSATDNLCVVGDWKQSIYGFQYASVENIQRFEKRLHRFRDELNRDRQRVKFPVDDVNRIHLVENYRSTQDILDFSENALVLEATKKETVDAEEILSEVTSLRSNAEHENTVLEAFTSDEEHEAVLKKIQEVVGNSEYGLKDGDGGLRPPTYGDIAVFTRTRDFGRELRNLAAQRGVPMAYEGGVELFTTDQALLLLAWLRVLEDRDSKRGWAVVLEQAGYTLDEAKQILKTGKYPSNMLEFRDELSQIDTLGGIARRVYERYGIDDPYADAVISALESAFSSTNMNRGDIVRLMERSIDAEAKQEVDDSPGGDCVTVQTIHAAKGLEYPVVIVANVNSNRFPSTGGGGDAVRYYEPAGLRQTRIVAEDHGHPYVYHNWRHDVLSKCVSREYDEERRLMYVAMTRAENHLLFSATNPSPFFENLPIEAQEIIEPEVKEVETEEEIEEPLRATAPPSGLPLRLRPHGLIDEAVYAEAEGGRGKEFGEQVHDFAERYVRGEPVEPSTQDEENVKEFLDTLEGELRAEERCYLPVEVDGEKGLFTGSIDLLHVTPETVEVIDFKTDLGRHAEGEYGKQLSVYYHVVQQCFPKRGVKAGIFYTHDGIFVDVEPLSMDELSGVASPEVVEMR